MESLSVMLLEKLGVMNTRTCNVCKEELCLTKFSKGRYTCRECRNKKRRELKQRHEPQFSKIKKCSKCGKEKKGSNFSLCKESTDGLRSVCKTCHTFFGKIKKFGIDQDKYEFMSSQAEDLENAKKELKDFEGAIEDYSKVTEIDPNYKWAYQQRGIAKSELNDHIGVIEDLSKVIEIDANNRWNY